jgi:hypothetical protein
VGETGLAEDQRWRALVAAWENAILPQIAELLRAHPNYLDALLRASATSEQGRPAKYPYTRRPTEASNDLDVDPPIQRQSLSDFTLAEQKEILRFLARRGASS